MGASSASPNHVKPDVSIDPDGKIKYRVGSQTFIEEPLGLPANDGHGWPQLEFNEAAGPDDRYVIGRKLGRGTTSSTWLAHDKVNNSYVAIKILIGKLTDLFRQDCVWELTILKRVSSPSNPHCLQLLPSPSRHLRYRDMCEARPTHYDKPAYTDESWTISQASEPMEVTIDLMGDIYGRDDEQDSMFDVLQAISHLRVM
ncbi:hypothetical protein DFH29DRAFT_464677 [Suillus ampliporus]|nr:hypothetical protein DFH29DRAFT_464677 [Suillus ampliporus]